MTTSPDVERLANLRAAKDLVDRSYAEALDLDAIAREAGYSRFHFIRSFRDTFGRTPREYLSFRRVERARELLRSANLTVTEVCYLVGFASLGSFSARFKADVGLSPSAYAAVKSAVEARRRSQGASSSCGALRAPAQVRNREEAARRGRP
jgi:AraC-like DNA-binding protein